MKNNIPVPQRAPSILPRLLPFTAAGSLALAALHFLFSTLYYRFHLDFDYGEHWPLSLAYRNKTPLAVRAGIAAGLLAAFAALLPWLRAGRFSLRRTLPAACALLIGTTCLQGYERGFIMPTRAVRNWTEQYYDDAMKITSAREFLATYNARQTQLTSHAQTHPPGAVLAYYYLARLLRHAALISVVIGIFSLSAGMVAVFYLVRKELGAPLAGYAAFLFALLPSVQIYGIASLDALIMAVFILALVCYLAGNRWVALAGTVLCLFCALMLTYAFIFLLVVFGACDLVVRKDFKRFARVILALILMLVLLAGVFKFNYLEGLWTAIRIENPGGFMLIASPLSYVATRLENICEIILFLGPVLCWLLFTGLGVDRHGRPGPLLVLARSAVATLLAIYLTGAFRTGETARSCLFITPFLIFPIAMRLDQVTSSRKATGWPTAFLACTFIQTVFMQFVGFYYW